MRRYAAPGHRRLRPRGAPQPPSGSRTAGKSHGLVSNTGKRYRVWVLADQEIVARAVALFGDRLRGVFVFGSTVTGTAHSGSDIDVGVWLDPPILRQTTWVPWTRVFDDDGPPIDPTFFTLATLDTPPGWLLECLSGGVRIVFDPKGELAAHFDRIRSQLRSGTWERRLFQGLPHFVRRSA